MRQRALLLLLLAGLPAFAGAVISSNRVRLVQDVTAPVSGSLMTPRDMVSVGGGSAVGMVDLGLPPGVQIDAFFFRSNVLFYSTDIAYEKDGIICEDEDLMGYDIPEEKFELYFDGSANGVPECADLDAASMNKNGDGIWLSFDTTISLPGAGKDAHPQDIVTWKGVSNFTVKIEASDLALTPRMNLDALACDSTNVYYSCDVPGTVAGFGSDKAIWAQAPILPVLWVDGQQAYAMAGGADIDGLDVPVDTDSDNDWLTDFEENTGVNEPVVFWEGVEDVDPAGHQTDPAKRDTDGDGIPDGEEAVAGTDPTEATNYLHIVYMFPKKSTGVMYVFWDSVYMKKYRVQQGTSADGMGYDENRFQEISEAVTELDTDGTCDWMVTNGLSARTNYSYRVRVTP